MLIFTIIVLILLFLIQQTCIVIPTREIAVLERFGKYHKTMEAGLHVIIPFIDNISYRHEIREQVLEVPPQNCITKDNIQVEVDGTIYLKVWDAHRASYGIGNYRVAAVNLSQTTMRSEIGKLTLHQSFSERESLNQTVVTEIDKASDSWGVKVMRYEIMNITPSADVVHTLEQAMEAERDRRAKVTLATAEKEATTAVSEGLRQEAINVSEGQKQRRINEAQGHAQEIALLAEATSYGIRRVAKAIAAPYGDKAVKTRIIQQYISELGKVMDQENVTVVPADLANIKGVMSSVQKMVNPLT